MTETQQCTEHVTMESSFPAHMEKETLTSAMNQCQLGPRMGDREAPHDCRCTCCNHAVARAHQNANCSESVTTSPQECQSYGMNPVGESAYPPPRDPYPSIPSLTESRCLMELPWITDINPNHSVSPVQCQSRTPTLHYESLQQLEAGSPENIKAISAKAVSSQPPLDLDISMHDVHTPPVCHSQATQPLAVRASLRQEMKIKCPFSMYSMLGSCDHNGAEISSKDGDLKVTVPEGAIRDGDLVKFYVATDLYGPFKLSPFSQSDLASPFYWIGVSGLSCFQKPVRVEFEHYAVVTACNPTHYHLLSCEDYDKSYIMRQVDYRLCFKEQNNRSSCTFETYHFCSYCLAHGCESCDQINKVGAFYLKPANFQFLHHFAVEIWLSFITPLCVKKIEELCQMRGMILDSNCSHCFEVSCEISSTSYFELKYDECIDGWHADHSRSKKILASEVNFYNKFKCKEDLEASEKCSFFPPRFVNMTKMPECTADLNTNIMVTLYKNINSMESIPFKLFVSLFTTSIKASTKISKEISPPSISQHSCDKCKPQIKELLEYSSKISHCWKQIATLLGIPYDEITTINIDNQNVENKCLDMFNKWLSRSSTSICWCHFIQALNDVGLIDLAEETKKHLSYDISASVMTSISPAAASLGEGTLNGEHSSGDSCNKLTSFTNEFVRYLIDIPDKDLLYFVSRLLPKHSAVEVIKDIRCSNGSKENKLSVICKAFLNESNPSWTKIYEALREAKCNDQADIVEVTFLPI